MPESKTYNQDCLAAMRLMPDCAFDLAIVDPPYGIGAAEGFGRSLRRNPRITEKSWDNQIPTKEYFDELFRVSQNQIICGGNYFDLPATRCFIIWDKQNAGRDFADCELLWTSFDKVARLFVYRVANDHKQRFHPTQKPVALYKFLLSNYAKAGDKILDTHLGSGSSRIAAYDLGFDFTGYELDTDYFDAQEERFKRHLAQPKLFEVVEKYEQEALF